MTDSGDFSGVRHAYDTVAEAYAENYPTVNAEAPLDLAMIDNFAAEVIAGGEPRILDAGCGSGRISRYLAGRGCLVDGVDLSPGMIDMARRDSPDLSFSVAPLTALPFPNDSFPGVVLWYSIIHTPPTGQAAIFAEVARVLQPGGHLLVGFHCGEGVRDVGEIYRGMGFDVELQRWSYTADDVAELGAGAGLRETARMVRAAREHERNGQASVLFQN